MSLAEMDCILSMFIYFGELCFMFPSQCNTGKSEAFSPKILPRTLHQGFSWRLRMWHERKQQLQCWDLLPYRSRLSTSSLSTLNWACSIGCQSPEAGLWAKGSAEVITTKHETIKAHQDLVFWRLYGFLNARHKTKTREQRIFCRRKTMLLWD